MTGNTHPNDPLIQHSTQSMAHEAKLKAERKAREPFESMQDTPKLMETRVSLTPNGPVRSR